MIVGGVDEAGLGPVLGPLVVSGAAFRLPDADAAPDLWSVLSTAITRKPARKPGGTIAIGDSKKLYNRKKENGLAPLERGVLTMISTIADAPQTLAELLDFAAPGALARADEYPWYAPADLALPQQAGATDIMLTANSLKLAMQAAGVELAGLRAEPMFVRQYNKIVEATNNKSTTVFDVTCRLLMWLWQSFPDEPLKIVVDRQGGRVHYRQPLQRVFPDCSLRVLEETDIRSAYRMTQGDRHAEIEFLVGGEGQSMATALASMLSKYLRELFMSMLNDFWAKELPGLDHTAGYYVDGRRFFAEIQPAREKLKIADDWLYRSR